EAGAGAAVPGIWAAAPEAAGAGTGAGAVFVVAARSRTLPDSTGRRLPKYASAKVQAKNTAASTAVVRDRKLALPLAPNRLPELPLPNAAPMSAPLPCWTRMSPIMPRAVSICTARTAVSNTFIPLTPIFLWRPRLARGGDDLQEIGRLERRAPDQPAVDIRLRQQRRGVGCGHAAAVEDLHAVRVLGRGLELSAQHRVDLLSLFRRCGPAGPDGPDRLIGHDDFADAVAVGMDHRGHLPLDDVHRPAGFALGQRLADAHDRRDAGRQRGLGLVGHDGIGFAVVLAALRVADDRIAHAEFLEHGGRDFARVGALHMLRHVLRAEFQRRARAQRIHLRRVRRGHADRRRASGVPHALDQSADQGLVGRGIAVHLPVACDQLSFHACSDQVSTILPMCWFDSMSSCALAASPAGKTLWMTGLMAPLSSSGQTLALSERAIAALNSTGRGRRVEPVTASRLRSTRPALNSLFTPPCTAMIASRPSSARHSTSRAT